VRKRLISGLAVCSAALALLVSPAWAHHSFNAYDMSKTATMAGTIKEFRWGAPHASMVLAYKDKSGKQGTMSVVTGSPTAFSRQGFKPRDFKKGDPVTLVYHPNVNGTPGGAMSALTLPDGRTYKDAEAAAGGPPGGPPVSAPPAGAPRP
jgi:Family of unknown function (DUF6152)